MSNVIQFPKSDDDNHGYTLADKKVTGVYYRVGEYTIEWPLRGSVAVVQEHEGLRNEISQDDLKHLMIMWLSMVDPEVLNYDKD